MKIQSIQDIVSESEWLAALDKRMAKKDHQRGTAVTSRQVPFVITSFKLPLIIFQRAMLSGESDIGLVSLPLRLCTI